MRCREYFDILRRLAFAQFLTRAFVKQSQCRKGLSLQLSIEVWPAVAEWSCGGSDWTLALELFREMPSQKLLADVYTCAPWCWTFSTLRILGNKKQLKGIYLESISFISLIHFWERNRNCSRFHAAELSDSARYNSGITALSRGSHWELCTASISKLQLISSSKSPTGMNWILCFFPNAIVIKYSEV